MALLKQHPRRKKSGKSGGFIFAAFVVSILLLLVAGYFVNEYITARSDQEQKIAATRQTNTLPKRDNNAVAKTDDLLEDKDNVGQDYSPDDALENLVTHFYDADTASPDDKVVEQRVSAKPQLAIVIDDLGNSKADATALAEIGLPITFSVIPGLRFDKDVADFAKNRGIEVIVHMPMQSKAYPQRRMENNGLLLSYSVAEVQKRVLKGLQDLPQATGLSNHTGSAFTEDADKMKAVLEVLKKHKLFFVDSVTTADSAGYKTAKQLRVPTVRRDVFLDNEQNEQYISGQLEQAVSRALKTGHAVAIGHPHAATITVLAKELPLLKAKGVELVYVSRLVD